jgi:hypothetical protein
MDIEPTLGKFMDAKMDLDEDAMDNVKNIDKVASPDAKAHDYGAEIKGISDEDDTEEAYAHQTVLPLEEDKDKEPRDGVKSAASKLGIKPKHVKEVSSREGSRIEGLLSIPLKSKFLEAFQDLYFDLVEEDPFMAEDVVDHLGIEMLKHLDAIQAQGDRLNSVNTDADFEREQRAQLDMREEDSIEEGISTSDITKALKDDAKATDSEIKQYMASVKKAGDKFDDVDDYVEDFKNYVADKSLQEHFGRFMKDYQ